MAELRWTQEALDWLEDIYRYIAQDNPQAAANVIDGILKKVDVLTAFPNVGTRYGNDSMIRSLTIAEYREEKANFGI